LLHQTATTDPSILKPGGKGLRSGYEKFQNQ
jgi:hypothetical protein